jgi:uncharacterized damage-inducible protein DinB
MRSIKNFETLKDDYFAVDYTYKDVLFPSREDYLLNRKNLDEKIIRLVEETDEIDYQKKVKYINSKGQESEKLFSTALMQVFVHEIHNRGMISLYLEMMGKENDFSAVLPLDYMLAG